MSLAMPKVKVVTARAQAARMAMLNALPVTKLRAIWRENGHALTDKPDKRELVRIMTFNWDACRLAVFEELEALARSQ